MEQFPSKIALMLARKRIIQRNVPQTELELQEKIEAGVKIAINYDGAQIVLAILTLRNDYIPYEAAQDIWDKIQGKQ